MSEVRISARYALSLFDLALEQGNLELVCADMKLFASVCHENHTMANILKSPVIDGDKKMAVIDGIFSKHFNKLSLVFMKTVIKKRREKYLIAIANDFIELYKENKNIVTAHISTAAPLNDEAKKQIVNNLQQQTGKSVELDFITDPALIGGIKIKVGDKLFDDSIARQLNNLKLHLLN